MRNELAPPFGPSPAVKKQVVDTIAYYASYRDDVHGKKFEWGFGSWARAKLTFSWD
jgi:hypothetical protein